MHPRRSPRPLNAIEPAAIERCVETIRVALGHYNRDECIAAIDRAFGYQAAPLVVEFSTPVADLGLDVRTVNTLEDGGIKTVGALCGTTPRELEQIPQAGPAFIKRLREVMEKYKLPLRNPRAWRGYD